MPIAMWYPAAPVVAGDRGERMRLREYVASGAQSVGIAPANEREPLDAFTAGATSRGIERADIERLLDTPGLAVRNAPPAIGRFTLVLFVHGSVEGESVMAEYLASYGYIVAAVRSRGATEPTYRLSRANLDAMVLDQEFVATHMQREPNVAEGPIGLIGMSNGSIATLALQLRRTVGTIGAVVSLDGGIGENAGGTYLRERSGGDVSALRAPLLHFYAPHNQHLNLEHLRSYRDSQRTLIFVRNMRHADFLAHPAFERALPGFTGAAVSPDAHAGFVWVNRYTLHFLDAHLRGSGHGRAFLATTAETQGAPAGLMEIERLN